MTTDPRTSPEAGARVGRYDPKSFEQKWRDRWEADGLYVARDDDPRRGLAARQHPHLVPAELHATGDDEVGIAATESSPARQMSTSRSSTAKCSGRA